MAFEVIINAEKSATATPSFENGARISYHNLKSRHPGKPANKYVKITLGKNAATSLSFISERHQCQIMLGNGDDTGQIAVKVDNQNGEFAASKSKVNGTVAITIKGETAKRLFAAEFETVYLEKAEIVRPPNAGVFGLLKLSDHPEIFAEAE